MTTQQLKEAPYTYSRGTDGCDETFDPHGVLLVSIHFWEQAERAEADAKLIVHRLNCHNLLLDACKRTLRNLELMLEMDDPWTLTQIEWEAEPLDTLRKAIAEAEAE